VVHSEDRRHAAFLKNADLLIHDAQYTAIEYPSRVGWGHSTVEYVVDVALAAEVKRLALFHHDPLRDDAAVDGLVEACRKRVAKADGKLEVLGASEGLVLNIVSPEHPS
jgi:ribonuclease BN (tRNA processing enzyme)